MTKASRIATAVICVTPLVGVVAVWNPMGWNFHAESHGHAGDDLATDHRLYTCGMHPQIIQEGPGSCPICGMDLVPLKPNSVLQVATQPVGVRVSQNFVQNFAVRTTEVVRDHLPAQIRTIGYLDQNEERLISVSTKFEGWIERAHVNTVGERVSQGDKLFEIFSPELVTAQQEYLAAIDYVEALRSGGAYPDAVRRAKLLSLAARDRLLHWDLTAQQIEKLRTTKEVGRTLDFFSPASGFVVDKVGDSLEGLRLTPGMTVLKIADHSTLWAKVEFYEHDVRDLRTGLRADITLDAFPGRRWAGEVLFFRPSMNPQTQTLTGFIEVDNSNGLLRPKMYATVHIRLPGVRDALVVPAQSVLHSGERAVVIVAEAEGFYVPREVELGLESEGKVQVLKGVEAGQSVVTSSQFLIDSESNLRTAIARLLSSEEGGAKWPLP